MRSSSAVFLIFFAVFALFLLVGPRVPNGEQQQNCVSNQRIHHSVFGVSLNCDSYLFIEHARDPGQLLQPEDLLQTRPGMIVTASVLGIFLTPLRDVPRWVDLRNDDTWIPRSRVEAATQGGFPAYAAFIILNTFLVAVAFYTMRRLVAGGASVGDRAQAFLLASLGIVLVANDLTKAFFWSPHSQMFNLVAPLAGVAAFLWASQGGLRQQRVAVLVGLAAGWGLLCYGFWIIVPCAIVVGLAFDLRQPGARLHRLAAAFVCLALSAAPLLLWVAFVRWELGAVYSVEVERYRQFVWILDTLPQGLDAVVTKWFENVHALAELGVWQAVPALGLLVIAGCIGGGETLFAASLERRRLILACLAVTGLAAALHATIGFVQARLAYTLAPPLILSAAAIVFEVSRQVSAVRRTTLTATSLAYAVGLAVWIAWKAGPYS